MYIKLYKELKFIYLMNINKFLSVNSNFIKVKKIYERNENVSIYDKKLLKFIDGNFYLCNEVRDINEIISYQNNNIEVKKIIGIIEQLNLISETVNKDLKWLDLFYSKTYPNCENNFKIYILSALEKLLKENHELKE